MTSHYCRSSDSVKRQCLAIVRTYPLRGMPDAAAHGYVDFMRLIGSLLAAGIVACSSSSERTTEEPAFSCAIGELRGTWRISYEETDGNCGPVADETAILNPDADPPDTGCTMHSELVSDDKCRMDMDFTCPLAGGVNGEQRWTGTVRHTEDGILSGSMTIQASGSVSCRSTYAVTWTRQ
jgi:hypothetical protein